MYDYIKGLLTEITPSKIILDANGIGYKILVPTHFSETSLELNSSFLCYTSLVVKEDSHTLFGFSSKQQRDLFETLLTVSGIGPKTALALISTFIDLSRFYSAVSSNNIALISKVPGIGKKGAEKLIIEMRDKLKSLGKDIVFADLPEESFVSDALHALIKLGYNHLQAHKAIKKAMKENSKEKDTGKLISLALKKI